MSQVEVAYDGYGVDLGDYTNRNKDYQLIVNILVDNFSDFTDDNSDISYVMANNTDNFKALAYIPAVVPVSIDKIKTYNKEEARQAISSYINDAISRLISDYKQGKLNDYDYLTEKLSHINWKDLNIIGFRESIQAFVYGNSDYSYNNVWVDYL